MIRSFAALASLGAIVVAIVAGALVFPRTVVKTRTVHVVDQRPAIRAGVGSAVVLANFAGKPYRVVPDDGSGFRCSDYMQNQSRSSKSVGSWVVRVCLTGPAS